tara:strand:- start:178 stop:435 length:258 start_codon:yes stop_codon:yes gene_type:complete
MEWYKFLANTEVPWRQWTRARWAYNLVDYSLWIVGIGIATQTVYLTYITAPTFNILQMLILLVGVATAAVFFQKYNDNVLVPKGE